MMRRMDTLSDIVTWEPLISLFTGACGWIWGAWEWFSGRKEAKAARQRHMELLAHYESLSAHNDGVMALLRRMEGASPEEQQRIVKTAETLSIRATFSSGTPTFRAELKEP